MVDIAAHDRECGPGMKESNRGSGFGIRDSEEPVVTQTATCL